MKIHVMVVRSMRGRYALVLVVASILNNCNTFEAHDYRIAPAGHGDAARVQCILRDVATETGIPRSAPTPYDSPTIALYHDSKVQLRASVSQGDIRIMLMRYAWPTPKAFRQADDLLVSALSSAFDGRFKAEAAAEVERTITVH